MEDSKISGPLACIVVFFGLITIPFIPLYWLLNMKKKPQFYILEWIYQKENMDSCGMGVVDEPFKCLLESHPDVTDVHVIASSNKPEIIESLLKEINR